MKGRTYLCIVAFVVLAAASTRLLAQDGLFFSATPPLVVRFDKTEGMKLTKTTSKILHGITLHATVDGKEISQVIIDTIQPDATVLLDGLALMANNGELTKLFFTPGSTITCTNYSKPLLVPAP